MIQGCWQAFITELWCLRVGGLHKWSLLLSWVLKIENMVIWFRFKDLNGWEIVFLGALWPLDDFLTIHGSLGDLDDGFWRAKACIRGVETEPPLQRAAWGCSGGHLTCPKSFSVTERCSAKLGHCSSHIYSFDVFLFFVGRCSGQPYSSNFSLCALAL